MNTWLLAYAKDVASHGNQKSVPSCARRAVPERSTSWEIASHGKAHSLETSQPRWRMDSPFSPALDYAVIPIA